MNWWRKSGHTVGEESILLWDPQEGDWQRPCHFGALEKEKSSWAPLRCGTMFPSKREKGLQNERKTPCAPKGVALCGQVREFSPLI